MIKKEKLKAGKTKNCADAVKDIANDTLNVTKEFVKIAKKIIPAVWGRDYFLRKKGNYFMMTLAISRTLFE